jgi:PAS domain-containing protein
LEGALTSTLEGVILYSNEQFASLLALPLERVIGSSIRDFIAPEDAKTVSAILADSAAAKAEIRLDKETSGRDIGANIRE